MLANREMVGLRGSKGVSGRKNFAPLDEILLEIQDDTQVLHEVATKNEIVATSIIVKDKSPAPIVATVAFALEESTWAFLLK